MAINFILFMAFLKNILYYNSLFQAECGVRIIMDEHSSKYETNVMNHLIN